MYKFEKVDESIWVAAAVMTYEKYMSISKSRKVNEDDLYFKQVEVIKRGNKLYAKNKEIENARVSYHYNAQNDKSTYNYFIKRDDDSFVRLVYNGEINGNKEKPNNINEEAIVETSYGKKTMDMLFKFIDNEYTEIIKSNIKEKELNKQDYIEILDFLNKHAYEKYTKPEKIEDETEKNRCLKLRENAQNCIKKFKTIGDFYKKNGLFYDGNASIWLDGTNTKVRHYLWMELKRKDKKGLSTSISVVAEMEQRLRFRVSLEIRDNKSDENDYIRHFRYLDKLDVNNTNFEYFGPRNENSELATLSNEEIKKWIEDVKSRREKKLQIGRTLNYEEINSMSAEDIKAFFDNTINELIRYYEIAVGNDEVGEVTMSNNKKDIGLESKNQILYGPPGTGKTYNVINKALEIIDREKYSKLINENDDLKRNEIVSEFNKLLEEGRIAFCTFHQSYGYEDFVEGLRSDEEGSGFVPRDGIFKQICERASRKIQSDLPKYDFDENKINFYKMSLGNKNDNDDTIFNYCIDNNCVALGWGGNINFSDCKTYSDIKNKYIGASEGSVSAVNYFVNNVKKDDIVIIGYGLYKARAIGRIIGNYEFNEDVPIEYKQLRKVEWLYKEDFLDKTDVLKTKNFSQGSIYRFRAEDLNLVRIRELISPSIEKENIKNYVLIIDEINRGNISKIFGELITLIEDDKRLGEDNELKVTLPYSNEKFGVPNNLYIIGTMNTADRSIALIDTALRRRFKFIEYMPDVSKLKENVGGINVRKLLDIINKRIEYLFDRDHSIGHAYFIKDNLSFDDLVSIMKNKVIPLLQEYFYGDWEKIELILGGAGSNNNDYFISKKKINANSLFNTNIIYNYQEQYRYSVVDNPSKQAFLNIYEGINE